MDGGEGGGYIFCIAYAMKQSPFQMAQQSILIGVSIGAGQPANRKVCPAGRPGQPNTFKSFQSKGAPNVTTRSRMYPKIHLLNVSILFSVLFNVDRINCVLNSCRQNRNDRRCRLAGLIFPSNGPATRVWCRYKRYVYYYAT